MLPLRAVIHIKPNKAVQQLACRKSLVPAMPQESLNVHGVRAPGVIPPPPLLPLLGAPLLSLPPITVVAIPLPSPALSLRTGTRHPPRPDARDCWRGVCVRKQGGNLEPKWLRTYVRSGLRIHFLGCGVKDSLRTYPWPPKHQAPGPWASGPGRPPRFL